MMLRDREAADGAPIVIVQLFALGSFAVATVPSSLVGAPLCSSDWSQLGP